MGKPKKVLFELIKPDQVFLSGQPYELLAEIRAEQHFDTAAAKIALAWRKGTKANADGKIVLGRCVKATDLQRELVDYDFVIVLNKEFWEDPEFDRAKKLALLDHEMCHAARALDSEGEPMIDSKQRPVWRVRGHDVEEFEEIVARHGVWKRDLERFVEAIAKRKKSPLFSEHLKAEEPGTPTAGLFPGSTKALTDVVDALDNLTEPIREGVVTSMTIQIPGKEPVVINRRGADQIHSRAKKKAKDPG
jgi:hypothetical protein